MDEPLNPDREKQFKWHVDSEQICSDRKVD